jgi:hypothetical protein
VISKRLTAANVETYLGHQWQFRDAAAVVLLVASVARTNWTYPYARAYRSLLAEAGHVCQTFCLAATWLELAPFCTMALADSAIEKALGIDGVTDAVLYAAGVGVKPDHGRGCNGRTRPREAVYPSPPTLRTKASEDDFAMRSRLALFLVLLSAAGVCAVPSAQRKPAGRGHLRRASDLDVGQNQIFIRSDAVDALTRSRSSGLSKRPPLTGFEVVQLTRACGRHERSQRPSLDDHLAREGGFDTALGVRQMPERNPRIDVMGAVHRDVVQEQLDPAWQLDVHGGSHLAGEKARLSPGSEPGTRGCVWCRNVTTENMKWKIHHGSNTTPATTANGDKGALRLP